jgi:phosphinothricin acetyltransferase
VPVRLAQLDDADAIRDIYNAEVSGSTVTFDMVPRTLDEQREWLTARSGAHAVLVATDGDQITGFGSLSPYRDRPAYATTVEDSIYVHGDHRGQRVGGLLLGELVSMATAHGFHTVLARVVGGHVASIALHESVGFTLVGVEREVGRKFGQWLDVVLMQRLLDADGD